MLIRAFSFWLLLLSATFAQTPPPVGTGSISGKVTIEGKPAPGKYWLIVRKVPDDEAAAKRINAMAWDITTRKSLRIEAEAANQTIELKSCQRVNDSVLRFVTAK